MILFEILLFIIGLTGFVFGSFFISSIENKYNYELYLIKILWYIIPILFLFGFYKEYDSFFREVYLYSTGLMFIFYSILSALLANHFEQVFESKYENTKKIFFYCLRIFTIAYGALCLSISTAVIKSTSFHLGITEYIYDGKKLNDLISNSLTKTTYRIEQNKECCKQFIKNLNKIENNSISLEGNTFSFFSGNYNGHLSKNLSFKYSFERGIKGIPSNHFISYNDFLSPKSECFIKLSYINKTSRLTQISIPPLKKEIQNQIATFDYLKQNIKNKPPTLTFFSFASFSELIGIKGYNLKPKNSFTSNFDLCLLWFFYILTGVLFFHISKYWRK